MNETAAEKAIPTTSSPEFMAAVQAAVAEQMAMMKAQVLTELAPNRGGPASAPRIESAGAGDPASWMESLAMAIATLTDQGTGRKRVSPDVMKKQVDERKEMVRLILEARATGIKPRYSLTNKVYFSDQVIDPIWIGRDKAQNRTEIDWDGVPNDAMQPVNDVAARIYSAYLGSTGGAPKVVEDAPMAVTPKGLTVFRGRQRPAVPGVHGTFDEVDDAAVVNGGEVKIAHQNEGGRYVERRVLGTVAAPARQTV
jgi:hypothetical protein